MYITLVVLGTPFRGNQLSVLRLRWLFGGYFLAAVTCAEIFCADYGSSIPSLLASPNNRLLSYVLAFFILVSLATGVRSEFPSPSFLYGPCLFLVDLPSGSPSSICSDDLILSVFP